MELWEVLDGEGNLIGEIISTKMFLFDFDGQL